MLLVRIFAEFFAPLRTRREILPLLMMVLLLMGGMSMVAPSLPLYAKSFEVGTTMIGLIITVFGVGRIFANIPSGMLSERWGRKPLIIGGPVIVAIGSVGAALAVSLEALIGWRMLQGFGSGVYMTAAAASLADLAKPGERGRIMSMYQAALLTGVGIGPAFGGVLADRFGFTAPFWGYGLLATCGAVFAVFVCRETRGDGVPKPAPDAPKEPGVFGVLLRDPRFLLLCVVVFGIFFTRTAAQWQLVPLLAHERFDMDLDVIGLIMATSASSQLVMLPITGLLIDRYGARRVIMVSTLSAGVALTGVALAQWQPAFWLSIAVLGLVNGLGGPATATYAADIAPKRGYGHAFGLQRSVGDIGFMTGPLLIGLADDFGGIGYTGGLWLNAALVLIGALTFTIGSLRISRTK